MFLNNSPQDLRTTFWQRDLCDCGQTGSIPSRIVSLNPASTGERCHGELPSWLMGRRGAGLLPLPPSPCRGVASGLLCCFQGSGEFGILLFCW